MNDCGLNSKGKLLKSYLFAIHGQLKFHVNDNL